MKIILVILNALKQTAEYAFKKFETKSVYNLSRCGYSKRLSGSMGWRLKRSDHENLLKKTLGKNKDKLTYPAFFSYPPKKITSIPNSIEIRKIKEIKKKNIKDKKLKIVGINYKDEKKGLRYY